MFWGCGCRLIFKADDGGLLFYVLIPCQHMKEQEAMGSNGVQCHQRCHWVLLLASVVSILVVGIVMQSEWFQHDCSFRRHGPKCINMHIKPKCVALPLLCGGDEFCDQSMMLQSWMHWRPAVGLVQPGMFCTTYMHETRALLL